MASGNTGKPMRPIRVPAVAPLARAAAVLVAFVLGTGGFAIAYAQLGRPLPLYLDAFKAVQLIVGNFPSELENRDLPWSLDVARWALPLLTFWSTIALGWVQLRNPLRLMAMHSRGEHLVIAGDAGVARQAALGELANGRRVLLWVADTRAPWVDETVEEGGAKLAAAGEALGVAKLGLDKARGVMLLAPDDIGNTALASSVVAQAERGRPAGDPLDVITRIDNLDLRQGVEGRFARSGRSSARVRLVSLPDIAARELFLAHPLDAFRRAGDTARRLFLFGYTPMIERYILRLLAGGHFRDGARAEFILTDPRGKANEAAFHDRNPGADALSPIRFERASIDQAAQGPRLMADLVERYGAPIAIVIDCEDDARSLAFALAIDAYYTRANEPCPPIHVHLVSRPDERLGASIFAFGGYDQVADPEMLLQERHDVLARSIHDFYLEGRLTDGAQIGAHASMREWEDLPESFRDDNRLVADCYQLKLRDLGARLADGAGPPLRLHDTELEDLARAEHDRWMAAKLATGWTGGPVRDDTARIHPDIVPYEALSEPIKDLDREQIRMMTRLLGKTDQRALRTLTVVLDPARSASFARVADLLPGLAEQYPDRVPLIAGLIEHAASRAALLEAAAMGQRVRLFVSANLERLMAGLPDGERAALQDLARSADSIVALAQDADGAALLRSEADLVVTQAGGAGPVFAAPADLVAAGL